MGSTAALTNEVRRKLVEVESTLPVYTIASLAERERESVWEERQVAEITGVFSTLTLLLTCMGLYGLIAYTTSCKTNEIGLRMAVGATRLDVILLVFREVLILVFIGIALASCVILSWDDSFHLSYLTSRQPISSRPLQRFLSFCSQHF